ncbi:hypothetical protein GJAV_G00243680 [Gymnothorax javanicus]|nr:hypothetical protein GJAV_G00243680 [Gymnothorax javanicus]
MHTDDHVVKSSQSFTMQNIQQFMIRALIIHQTQEVKLQKWHRHSRIRVIYPWHRSLGLVSVPAVSETSCEDVRQTLDLSAWSWLQALAARRQGARDPEGGGVPFSTSTNRKQDDLTQADLPLFPPDVGRWSGSAIRDLPSDTELKFLPHRGRWPCRFNSTPGGDAVPVVLQLGRWWCWSEGGGADSSSRSLPSYHPALRRASWACLVVNFLEKSSDCRWVWRAEADE